LDCNHEKKYKSIQELQQDLNKLVLKNYKFFQDNEIENFKDKLDSTQKIDKYEKDFGLSKIVGMKDLKKLLQEDIIQPLQEVERYKKYGIQPLNGILLYGPAGCGKTYIAQKLAEELDFYYIEIKPSDLASTYIHGTQEKIGQLFQRAKMEAPTLIFMDEVDAILPKRDLDSLNLHYAAEVNEFLAQMTDCMNNKILIVAATNRPEIIEPAILRTGRLDKSIYIGLPDFNTRLEILELELQTRPCTLDLDIHNLAIITTGYTSSDLKFLVNEVAKLALTQSDLISNEYFKTVTHKYRSSISKDQIEKYEQFKNKS
jgi:transitional endoplasmic reticulum ATPase